MGDLALQKIRDAELTEAVDRLRKEHDDLVTDHSDGYEAGRSWFLSHASYGDIRQIVERVKEKGLPDCTYYATEAASQIGIGRDRIKSSVRMSQHQWMYGFLQAVVDLWGEVGDTIEQGETVLRPWDN